MGSAHVILNLCLIFRILRLSVVNLFSEDMMVGYTNAKLDGMKTYIEYLSQRPKRRRRRTAYH